MPGLGFVFSAFDRAITLRVSVGIMVGLLVCSGVAAAQTPPEDLSGRLKHGSKVAVTDGQGREFKGRIIEVSPESVTLATRRERAEVRYSEIVKIDKVDDLKNGAIIGALVGAGLFAADALYSREEGITLNAAGYAVFGALYSGLGAGAGAILDALIGGDRSLYTRGGAPRVSVGPTLGRDRAGALMIISW